jgi:hypothetical protein
LRLVPPVAQELEGGHALLITTHHLAVDQAGPDLEVIHGLGHQRVAVRPVVTPPGNQPDAYGIAPGHEPVAVMFDLVNPVGAGRELVGGGWETGFDEARPVGGQAFTHTLDQHAANSRSRGEESSRHLCASGLLICSWSASHLRRSPFDDQREEHVRP